MDKYPVRANEPETQKHNIVLEGGSSAVSIFAGGRGMTITRDGTGVYTLAFTENPGTFLGWKWALGAATPANVATVRAIRDEYDSATYSLQFTLYDDDATPAAHDLAADEYLDIELTFKQSGV